MSDTDNLCPGSGRIADRMTVQSRPPLSAKCPVCGNTVRVARLRLRCEPHTKKDDGNGDVVLTTGGPLAGPSTGAQYV